MTDAELIAELNKQADYVDQHLYKKYRPSQQSTDMRLAASRLAELTAKPQPFDPVAWLREQSATIRCVRDNRHHSLSAKYTIQAQSLDEAADAMEAEIKRRDEK